MYYTGLLGRNISYSRSPEIHNTYYEEHNIPFSYKIYDTRQEDLDIFIKNLTLNNIVGFNVTIPYKETIIKYLDKLVYPADKIGAVNTVAVKDNKLIGYNTDYIGFKESLECNNINIEGSSTLIIGTGGAAKCVYRVLKDLNASNIDVFSRNPQKTKVKFPQNIKILNIGDENNLKEYDVIVNCTPLGGANYKDMTPIKLQDIRKECIVYDLNYEPKESKFLKESKLLGAVTINGEDMLKLQAYASINLWKIHIFERGKKIDITK